jgi:hypothetical protein
MSLVFIRLPANISGNIYAGLQKFHSKKVRQIPHGTSPHFKDIIARHGKRAQHKVLPPEIPLLNLFENVQHA